MSKILELRSNRATLVADMKSILERNDKLTPEQDNRWKELDAQQQELKTQIDQLERTDALDAELRQVSRPANPQVGEADKRINPYAAAETRVKQIIGTDEYHNEFRNYLRTGTISDSMHEVRTYAGLGDASGAAGVTLVPVGFQRQLEIKLKAIGGIRQAAQILTTATGNPLHYPKMDDTANQGSWIAEATAVNQTNPSFSEVLLSANLASSDQVLASVQLLQDSAFDVEQFLADAFGIRLQRLTNLGYTKGSGSGQPTGLVTALIADGTRGVTAVGANSNSGNSNDTDVDSIGSDDLDNLITNVDPAYRMNGSFQANQATFDALRKVKDKYGRSIWSAGLAEKEPDTIRGYKYYYNQHMDTIAPMANSLLFGDFTKYIIRDVLGFQLVRFNELFMSSHQVGFQAYLRTDGNILQTGAFAMLQHPSS
jgi:HK97 family phage major capsid protein